MSLDIRSAVFAGMLCAGAVAAGHASAQHPPAYPAKPIRFVSTAPGAPPDVVARIIGERLAVALGQPIVVENRPGASGTIAMNAIAKAPPDGYTLGSMSPLHTVAQSLLPQLPYDTARDIATVRLVARASLFLVVRAGSPLRSVPELVAEAKARPGRLSYSSSGNGTPPHLAAELFKLRAGIDVLHVPYNGAQAATAALLSEQVDLQFASLSTAGPHLRSGKLRALATSGPARMPAFAEAPTLAELGFIDFDVRDWQGFVVPAGTPKPVIERIAAEVARVLEEPEVKERLARLGLEPVADSTPESFDALMRAELVRWAKVVREAGIRVD
jgi:tripartite-type tricarboxylate transporter receptor subunit TctC